MARPRTQLGTAGKVTVVAQVKDPDGRWVAAPAGTKPQRWRARTRFRDSDGQLRDVERFAPTKGKAETMLKVAIRDRVTPTRGSGMLRTDMAFKDAGKVWLAQVERPDSGKSQRSRELYRYMYERHVAQGSVANLTLREVNQVRVLRTYLQGVADGHGTGSAKTTRSVVSGILRMAVEDGVLDRNALRDVRPAKASKPKRETDRDTTRALTLEERAHLIAVATGHERAQHLDVSDLIAYMAGVGCRISEALGQQWADVDLQAGTVHIRGTKTASSDRVLTLAPWLVQRLQDRADRLGTSGLLFPSPGLLDTTKRRDLRNVHRVFREVLDEAGLPWATPHSLRRTVASIIDANGLSVAEAADYLGHGDAGMTARVYLGRKSTTARAAAVL